MGSFPVDKIAAVPNAIGAPSRRSGSRINATPARGAAQGHPMVGRRVPRWDLFALAISGAILAYVWRFQDLYRILRPIQYPTLVSLAAIGCYLFDRDRRRSLQAIRHPVTMLAIGIFGLAVLSVPTSLYPGRSFWFLVNDFGKTILLMILLAASVRAFIDVERYAFVLVVGAVCYALYVETNVTIGMGGRLGNLVNYDANDLGMLLVCTVPLAAYFVVRGRRAWIRYFAVFALALYMLIIVKSGSRGAFLGFIAVAAYLLLGFKSISRRTRVMAVAGAVALMLVTASDSYWAMMRSLLSPTQDYNWSGNADSGRMEVWKRGIGYMLQNPLTGVGARAFPVAEGTISPLAGRQDYGIGLKWSAAHNSFVEIGAELGILGLVALAALLFHGYRATRAPANRVGSDPSEAALGQALAGTLVGYAVAGFFLSQAYSVFMFVIYGTIAGYARVTRPQSMPGKKPPRTRSV